ncbi:MAG: hypothetical protein K8H86_12075, partial [Ignavibacteriaceae bacterium]|nr:hypothetical protein [Ignavibacteriaceae bacterium]
MKKILLFVTTIMLFFTGCSLLDGNDKTIDAEMLQTIVIRAVAGNITANDSLAGLINLSLPVFRYYNKFEIDSIVLNENIYYTVLLEFPNPLYNRFAVYDKHLNNYILDRSLNGFIKLSPIHINDMKFFKIEEQFISKDVFKIERLSLYLIKPESVNLSLRIFTRLETPDETYTQTVSEISDDRVKTELSSSKFSILSNKSDVFSFDDKQTNFKSDSEIFYNFVTTQIDSYTGLTTKPMLTVDSNSTAILSNDSTTIDLGEFSISITSDWKRIDNLVLTENLSQQLTGTRFLNEKLGAAISVIKLPEGSSAEDFITAKLINENNGLNRIRFSSNIETGKDVIQYFEYQCGTLKYLFIVKASKYTYDKFKDHYNN